MADVTNVEPEKRGAKASDENLTNMGVVEINKADCPDRATIIITGPARSGTSMVAGVLHELGLFMGSKLDDAVFEDGEIAAALEAGNRGEFARLCGERDKAYGRWGFKRPFVHRYYKQLLETCRNPRLVILFRDVLAIAIRNNLAAQSETLKALHATVEEYDAVARILDGFPCPTLLLSYEKCLQFPDHFVDRISSFCGLAPDQFHRYRAMGMIENGRPEYVSSARLSYKGFVDGVIGERLFGWVAAVNDPKRKPKVVLYVDRREVATTTADRYRADLAERGFGNGKCAFEFQLPNGLSGDERIHVRVENSFITISNSNRPLHDYNRPVAPFHGHELGAIDGTFGNILWGWVHLDDLPLYHRQPSRHAEIALYLDGREVARTKANQYRADLARRGYHEGNCAFKFILPEGLSGKEIVHIRLGDSMMGLGNGGRALEHYQASAVPVIALEHGAIDGTFGQWLWGWAHIPGRADKPQLVLLLDGKEISTVSADRKRRDLEVAGYDDGQCAFVFTLPAGLSGREVVEIRLKDSFTSIRNSGRALEFYSKTVLPAHVSNTPRHSTEQGT